MRSVFDSTLNVKVPHIDNIDNPWGSPPRAPTQIASPVPVPGPGPVPHEPSRSQSGSPSPSASAQYHTLSTAEGMYASFSDEVGGRRGTHAEYEHAEEDEEFSHHHREDQEDVGAPLIRLENPDALSARSSSPSDFGSVLRDSTVRSTSSSRGSSSRNTLRRGSSRASSPSGTDFGQRVGDDKLSSAANEPPEHLPSSEGGIGIAVQTQTHSENFETESGASDGSCADDDDDEDDEPVETDDSLDKLSGARWVNLAKSYSLTNQVATNYSIPPPLHDFESHSAADDDMNDHELLYQPSKREVEYHSMRTEPVIYLETITSQSMRWVLSLSYFLFFAALAFGAFERGFMRSAVDYGGTQDPVLNATAAGVKVAGEFTHVWEQVIPFRLHDRYFSLSAKLSRAGAALRGVAIGTNVRVAVQAFAAGNELNDHSGVISRDFSISLVCREHKEECDEIPILFRENSPFGRAWQDIMLDQWSGRTSTPLELRLQMFSKGRLIDLIEPSNGESQSQASLLLHYEKSSQSFWIISLVVQLTLFGITLVCAIAYSHALSRARMRVVAEQKWVVLLFASILLFQVGMLLLLLPIQFPFWNLEVNRRVFEVTGNVLQAISTNFFGCFWLLVADTIRKIAVEHEATRLLSAWKILLGLLNVTASVIWILISSGWEVSLILRGPYGDTTSSSALLQLLYLTAIATWCVTTALWFIWVVRLSFLASRELRYWNFQTTRFRQLSFRFFVNQSWLTILYLAFIWAVWFASNFGVYGTRHTPATGLATFGLLTCYTLLSAYVHLPVGEKDLYSVAASSEDEHETVQISENPFDSHERGLRTAKRGRRRANSVEQTSGFSLSVARLMCDLSWESYGHAPGAPRRALQNLQQEPETRYPVNVERYGFSLVRVVHSRRFDVQWIIAVQNPNVISIAFRGTRSSQNLRSDLNFGAVPVNNNFWYTGDSSHINPANRKNLRGTTRMHSGFLSAYLDCREEIISTLAEVILQASSPRTSPRTNVRKEAKTPRSFAHTVPRHSHDMNIEMASLQSPSLRREFFGEDVAAATRRKVSTEDVAHARGRSQSFSNEDVAKSRKLSTSSLTGLISADKLVAEHVQDVVAQRTPLPRKSENAASSAAAAEDAPKFRKHSDAADGGGRKHNSVHISREAASKFTVYVTGHSLGAALATMCALELRCRFGFSPRLYTFGSPRLGSRSFARLFKAVMPSGSSFRMVFEQDFITTLPSRMMSFSHVDVEVYIDRAGNLIFSPSFVDKSVLPTRSRFDHHQLRCYRIAIDAACSQRSVPPRPSDDDFAVEPSGAASLSSDRSFSNSGSGRSGGRFKRNYRSSAYGSLRGSSAASSGERKSYVRTPHVDDTLLEDGI